MNHGPLKIAIADADESALQHLRESLVELGHEVTFGTATAASLIHAQQIIELIIADVNAVGEGHVHAIATLLERRDVPLVVTSASASDEAIDVADACRPLAHLIKPIRRPDLKAAISLATQRFEELHRLREEASSTRQALADRKVIEKAKGAIMRQRGIDEASAFKDIQKLAREHRQPLVEIAKSIITAEAAFNK